MFNPEVDSRNPRAFRQRLRKVVRPSMPRCSILPYSSIRRRPFVALPANLRPFWPENRLLCGKPLDSEVRLVRRRFGRCALMRFSLVKSNFLDFEVV